MAGIVVIILADIALALATGIWTVFLGVALWGLYLGLTHGVLSALVADTAPEKLRGTAFGLFNLVSGIAMLLASVIAGILWDTWGAPAPFIASAAFAGVALLAWLLRRPTARNSPA